MKGIKVLKVNNENVSLQFKAKRGKSKTITYDGENFTIEGLETSAPTIYRGYSTPVVIEGDTNVLTINWNNLPDYMVKSPIAVSYSSMNINRTNIANAEFGSYILNLAVECIITFDQSTISDLTADEPNVYTLPAGSYECSDRYDGTYFRFKALLQS